MNAGTTARALDGSGVQYTDSSVLRQRHEPDQFHVKQKLPSAPSEWDLYELEKSGATST